MINLRTFSLIFILTLFSFSCSSKDWNGPTGETNDPTVISIIPPNAARDISTTTNVVAFFSKDMDPSSINGGNFFVSNITPMVEAERVDGSVTYDAGQRAAVFRPNMLRPNNTYLVTVTNGVKDASGRSMLTGYTWEFTTH